MSKPKVYVVEVCAVGYHSQWVFHSVYANREAAEFCAAELRCKTIHNDDPCDDGQLVYDAVFVSETTLH